MKKYSVSITCKSQSVKLPMRSAVGGFIKFTKTEIEKAAKKFSFAPLSEFSAHVDGQKLKIKHGKCGSAKTECYYSEFEKPVDIHSWHAKNKKAGK